MNRQFDLLIFDWDGTLIDSIEWIAHCLQQAGERCGCTIPDNESAKGVIGLSIKKAIQALFPDADEPTQTQLIAHYSQGYFSKPMSRDDLFPGVADMLVQLKQSGYQLAVATGKTRVGLQAALQATGMESLFCVTRCSDETASKPDPKMLHEILQQTHTPKERAVMIGDSIHDLQMAHNAQISAIAVSCGAHSAALLQDYRPLHCLQHPTQLLNII